MHRYWYDNTWISSDILMSIYLDLPAEQRGLNRDPNHASIFYFGGEYPQQAVEAYRGVTGVEALGNP